mgnify:CR=1 FL=1
MPERNCESCVKLAKRRGQPYCMVLKEIQPPPCWAHSDDPEFWERTKSAIEAYVQLHEPALKAG